MCHVARAFRSEALVAELTIRPKRAVEENAVRARQSLERLARARDRGSVSHRTPRRFIAKEQRYVVFRMRRRSFFQMNRELARHRNRLDAEAGVRPRFRSQ